MNVIEAQMEGKLDYSGQTDFYDPTRHAGAVSVIGAGGIGSPTIIGLAKLGVPIINVYDDDVVEPKNVSAQHFEIKDVGQGKAQSIVQLARNVSVAEIKPYEKRVTADDKLMGDIVISAVDSMKSRKEIYESAKKSPSVRYLIDGRLGGQLIVCYVIDIRNKEHVEYYLSDDVMFDDSESESNVCTARAVCDVGFAVSALIIRAVRRILTGMSVEKLQILNMDNLRLDVSE